MKLLVSLTVAVLAFFAGDLAHSQAPVAAQTTAQKLQAIRARNKELLDRQAETLRKLEEIKLEAQQLKFLGKRA